MKPRLSALILCVDDLERSLRFSRDGLGLQNPGIIRPRVRARGGRVLRPPAGAEAGDLASQEVGTRLVANIVLCLCVATGIVVAILALGVPLEQLLEFVNIGTLSAFVIVCAGVMVLRFTHAEVARPFRVPFGPVIVPAIGIVLCVWLTVQGLSPVTWLRFLVWFVVGLAIYALYGYRMSLLRAR